MSDLDDGGRDLVDEPAEDVPPEEGEGPLRPWLWRDLTAQEQMELWVQLGDFVGYLCTRYVQMAHGSRLASCWYRHPIVVEELTALMVAHEYAYGLPDPSPSLVEYHERSLWPTLSRVQPYMKTCVQQRSHQDEPPVGSWPWQTTDPGFEQHILSEFDRATQAEADAEDAS